MEYITLFLPYWGKNRSATGLHVDFKIRELRTPVHAVTLENRISKEINWRTVSKSLKQAEMLNYSECKGCLGVVKGEEYK